MICVKIMFILWSNISKNLGFVIIVEMVVQSIVFVFLMLSTTILAFFRQLPIVPIAYSQSKSPKSSKLSAEARYSIPDQPQRFANAKKDNNRRYLDITTVYDPSFIKGKTVLVTGGNSKWNSPYIRFTSFTSANIWRTGGLGLAIVQELINQKANVIVTSRTKADVPGSLKVIDGIDVTDNKVGDRLIEELQTLPKIDILINNAGYLHTY